MNEKVKLKWLNHKLYNRYFPISCEKSKHDFLVAERTKLTIAMKQLIYANRVNVMHIEEKYVSKMKNTVSIFGNVKYGNIIHNKSIIHEMDSNIWREKCLLKINEYEHILNEIVMNENVSIEHLNKTLEVLNIQKKNFIKGLVFRFFVCELAIGLLFSII